MKFHSFSKYIPISTPLTIVDIGARGGVQDRWEDILYQISSKLVGFEPDKEECDNLNKQTPDNQLFIPAALSSEDAEQLFYKTKSLGSSSLYHPNITLLSRFTPASNYDINETLKITTTTLDSTLSKHQINHVDFIKMDVEASELDIIAGASDTLQSVFGMEVEVWFNDIYKNQPLFSDVDMALRGKGFRLFDMARSNFFKRTEGKKLGGPKGQLVAGDALYFRDPLDDAKGSYFWENKKLPKCILILLVYGYYDYALEILRFAKKEQLSNTELLNNLIKIVKRSGERKIPYFRGRERLSNWLKSLTRWLSVREKDFLGN